MSKYDNIEYNVMGIMTVGRGPWQHPLKNNSY